MFRFPGHALLQQWVAARRFNALPEEVRSIVFYAEDGGYWPHFEPIISELTAGAAGREICYLTSSPTDPVLTLNCPRIHAFCIGQGAVRTSLFMSMRAGVCVMTMPDLETFHIKRSRARQVHYVYVFHSMVSTHMIYRKGAFDAFDTVMCVGPHHLAEIRAIEDTYGLKKKNLVEHGYGRLDTMLAAAGARAEFTATRPRGESPHVLVAPSWGPDGLLETRGGQVCRCLLDAGLRITVRPHPMTRRKWPGCMQAIRREFAGNALLTVESEVTSFESLQSADVMISDWSGAALEFAFACEKPVLFVDVPRKVNNPEYERIACDPLEVAIREKIGRVLAADKLADLPAAVNELIANGPAMRDQIRKVREQTVYNLGQSGKVGAEVIARLADEIRS